MPRRDKVGRHRKVLASAKALGIHVGEDIHRALQSHNAPHDQVFDKTINSSARLFMKNVAKHKAMPKVLKHQTPSTTYGRKCVLLVDSDRLRRDELTTHLGNTFKVAVASSKKDALQVLHMMHVHVVLVRIRFGKDTAVQLVHDCFERHMTVPIVVYVGSHVGNEEDLAQCLDAGACGYVDESLPPEILCFRLLDMTRSFDVTDKEWREFKPKTAENKERKARPASPEDKTSPHRMSAKSVMANGFRRSSRESPVQYESAPNLLDLSAMTALDIKIQDRQHYLAKQQHVKEIMTIQHSVLGIGHKSTTPLKKEILRQEAPAPTHEETFAHMYTCPHKVATMVQRHDYDVLMRPERDAVPEDPLLTHCLVVDPSTLCDAKAVLKRINRAYLSLQAGHLDAAIQWCTASLKCEPNHLPKWCLLLRGAIHDQLGDHRAALDDFDAALALDAKFHQAEFNRSVSLLKLGKDTQALGSIVAATDMCPDLAKYPEYVRNHALILRRMGRYEDARLVYATLVQDSVANNDEDDPTTLEALSSGLFDTLFCQSKEENAALHAAPNTRTPAMVDLIASRLYQYDFFARCPREVLQNVCQALVHVVVRNGETFYLAHEQPHAFYVCIHGTLSVHANLTLAGQDMDTMASSSTHRLRPGDVFGCVGASISSLMMYLADERTEVMYLSPTAFKETLEPHWLQEQHSRFSVLRRSPVFRMLTDSELGHIVSHSILIRFHKGDMLVQQNEYPKRLYILYKGICRFEQSFTSTDTEDCVADAADEWTTPSTKSEATVRPYHRFLEIPQWPMNFEPRKHQAIPPISQTNKSLESSDTIAAPKHTGPLPTIVYDIYPPALCGESAYKTIPEKARCSIIATTLVEALAVDMHQLKSLSVAKELFAAIISNAPLYVDAAKAHSLQLQHNRWEAIKGKTTVQLNKARWPVHKERLRHLPNGGSIVVPDEKIANQTK